MEEKDFCFKVTPMEIGIFGSDTPFTGYRVVIFHCDVYIETKLVRLGNLETFISDYQIKFMERKNEV